MQAANQITAEEAQRAYFLAVEAGLDRPLDDRERRVALGYWRAAARTDICADRIRRDRSVVFGRIRFVTSDGRTF